MPLHVSSISFSSSGGTATNGTWCIACVFGCTRVGVDACNVPSAVCAVPPKDEQVMLETGRGFNSMQINKLTH
jgi:hypothetical protein